MSSVKTYSQYVPNFSFENSQEIPIRISLNYSYSEINRCLGYCYDARAWPPEPNNCTQWYQPTFGTPDYYHRGATFESEVQVPENNTGIQEPCRYNPELPYGNAYCGLIVAASLHSDRTEYRHYREYLQVKLLKKLTQGAKYRVSFCVSKAGNSPWNEFSTNQIGAYFSEQSITLEQTYPLNVVTQITLNDQINQFLSQIATSPGYEEWMHVQQDFVPDDDMYYMTIGNFHQNFSYLNLIPTPPDSVQNILMYYYVDNIEIDSLEGPPDCWCGDDAYELKIETKPLQTDSTKCCYDIRIKPKDITTGCPLYGVKIFDNDDSENPLYEDLRTTPFTKGTTVNYNNICVNKTAQKSNVTFKIIYYTNLTRTDSCEVSRTMPCRCNCEQSNNYGEVFKIKIEKEMDTLNEKCCWTISIENTTDCHFPYKFLRLEYGGQYWQNMHFTDIQWNGSEVSNGVYEWTNSKNVIFPKEKIIVGKVCLTIHEYQYPVRIKIGAFSDTCDRVYIDTLMCGDTANCCDMITASLENINKSPYEKYFNACCWDLWISQFPTPNCDIYRINVYNSTNLNNWIWRKIQPTRPIDFNNGTGKPFHEFCVLSDESGYGRLDLIIKFYNRYGDSVCTKEVSAQCDLGHWRQGRRSDDIYHLKQRDFIINPNPAKDELNLIFYSNKEYEYEFGLFNLIGNKLSFIKQSCITGINNVKLDISAFSNGVYIIVLKKYNEIFSKQVVIIK